MTFSATVLVVAAFTFLLAGLVKGVIGLGLPTVAVGLLALVMTPAQAAAVLVVPSLVTNVWQLAMGPSFGGLVRRLGTMMVGICIGTVAGAGLIVGPNTSAAIGGLGAMLIVYGIVGLSGIRMAVPVRWEPWLSPVIGATTGVVTGATGVFVIPAVPYLQALGFEKDELVQALGLSFTVSTVALAAGLLSRGAFHISEAGASLLALAPALGGMFAGQWIRDRVSAVVFRRCFFAGLIALGGHLLIQSLK